MDRFVKDVLEIKSDISTMKIDIALLKQDSVVTKSNIDEIKTDLRETRDKAIRNEDSMKEIKNGISIATKMTVVFGSFISAGIMLAPKIQQFFGIIK